VFNTEKNCLFKTIYCIKWRDWTFVTTVIFVDSIGMFVNSRPMSLKRYFKLTFTADQRTNLFFLKMYWGKFAGKGDMSSVLLFEALQIRNGLAINLEIQLSDKDWILAISQKEGWWDHKRWCFYVNNLVLIKHSGVRREPVLFVLSSWVVVMKGVSNLACFWSE